jgi:superfamily II DNA helicase RecQ
MRFFTIPIQDSGEASGELNKFLSSHRVLSIERHFVADGVNSAWALCVNYVSSADRPVTERLGGRIDYREVLSNSDFMLYSKLRALRKALAEKDGVPPYALFTNEQLAEMVRRRATSMQSLEQISGVGPARTKTYGAAFLEILSAQAPADAVSADGRSPS